MSLLTQNVIERFPCFAEMAPEFEKEGAPLMARLPKGATIFEEGDPCTKLAFVVSGVVRVYKMAENGREMTLYRIIPGESCILSISSLLSNNPLGAIAVVEEEVQAILVTDRMFRLWMETQPGLQRFVFDLLSRRLSSVLTIVEEVAFGRVDHRMAKYLFDHMQEGGKVHCTHQLIATEIGTSREVVSRTLKEWELAGLVELGRGMVIVLDRNGLAEKTD